MNILVTGGLGFIGSRVCGLFLDHGHNVVAIDNLTTYSTYTIEQIYKVVNRRVAHYIKPKAHNAKFFHVREDICNYAKLVEHFKNIDVVVHLAACPRAALVANDQINAVATLTTGLNNVSLLAQQAGARLVYVSSSMVYGDFESDPQPETATCKPRGIYAAYKRAGELLVEHDWYKNYAIVRPTAVYGAWDIGSRVINNFIAQAIDNQPITVSGQNTALDLTYVDDAAYGIYLAATSNASDTFNISAGHSVKLVDAALAVKHAVKSSSQVVVKGADPAFPQRGALDIKKATSVLGYRPAYNFETGLRHTLHDIGLDM
jgi:nucleoside-diphosphate-sugar epimerase